MPPNAGPHPSHPLFRPNPGLVPPDLAHQQAPPSPVIRAPIYSLAGAARPPAVPQPDGLWTPQPIPWERRRPGVRLLRISGALLMLAGLAVVGYVLYTVRVDAAGAGTAQEQLAADFAADLTTTTTSPPAAAFADDDPTMAAAPAAPAADPGGLPSTTSTTLYALVAEDPPLQGQPIGRLQIPAAGVNWVMVEGVNPEDLTQGPGHMPGTALPGQPGNAVVSGHRTTHGAPFYHLDALQPGDAITIETRIGIHTYEVVQVLVVNPGDLWVTSQVDGAWLTLTTCHPRNSARQRLIVFAQLVGGPNHAAVASLLDGSPTPPQPPA